MPPPRRPSSTSTTVTKPLSILLKLTPAPTRLSESRSILRHLNANFGRLSYFFEGRHGAASSPNYIFTIFPNPSSYEKALASSPISIPTQSSRLSWDPINTPSSTLKPRRKTFRCELLPSNLDHEKSVASNPFRGPYEIHKENITYETLRHVGAPRPAIADFQLRNRELFFSRRKEHLLRMVEMGEAGLMGMWRRATQGKGTSEQDRRWETLDLESEMKEAEELEKEGRRSEATSESTERHEPH